MKISKKRSKPVTRRRFLAALSATVGAASNFAKPFVGSARAAAPHNVLFIFTDQERFARPAPAGLELPGHERLRRTGTTFRNHYVGAVMCSSSRAILMTGLQTRENGVFENLNVPWVPDMSVKLPTIGRLFQGVGYHAAYKGKWHLTRAFDQGEPERLFTAEMEQYGFSDYASPGDVVGHTLGGYQFDDLIADSAVAWMRRKGRPLNDDGKPWSLTVSLVNPHDVMYFNTDAAGRNVQDTGRLLFPAAPAPSHEFYKASWDTPLSASLAQSLDEPGRVRAHGEYQRGWDYILGHIPPEEDRWRRFMDFYVNSIRAVDLKLKRLLEELDALGMTENTIVVYTADHGEMGGAHGLRGKGPFAYDECIHVPMHVVHPDFSGGQSCRALTSHIDIAPSLLGMVGTDRGKLAEVADRELPGKDLTALLDKPSAADLHAVRDSVLFSYSGLVLNDSEVVRGLSEVVAAGENPKDPAILAKRGIKPDLTKRGTVRTVFDGRYKFTRYVSPVQRNTPATISALYRSNDPELFDLEKDPSEMINLAAKEGDNANLVLAMNQKLNAVMAAEFGDDDGSEMPDFKGITWTMGTAD